MAIEICLLFHSARSDNLGVAALTVSQITMLRDLAKRMGIEIKITLLDWKDPRPPCIEGPDITHVLMSGRDLIDPRRALAQMRAADVIIDIGAGDSFSDIYGTRRFRRMIWLKNLARVSRTPVVLAPQTFGPFSSRASKFWAARTVRAARVVATRDETSAAVLRQIGVPGPSCLASDIALKLPSANAPELGGVNIGINVSGLLWNGGYDQQNQFGLSIDYQAAMREIILRLKAQPMSPTVWLVPHVISERHKIEDDLRVAQALAWEIGDVRVAPAFVTPQAAKGFISGMDYFAGARMHACLAAFSTEVPVVPIAYSGKFARLFGALGYNHSADCRTLRQEAVISQVVEGFAQRTVLRENLKTSRALGLRKLESYERALEDVFRDLALGRDMLNPNMQVQHG